MKTITRKKAKILGLNRYFTNKPCKHGHICERYITNGMCLLCLQNKNRIYSRGNRNSINEANKKRYNKDPAKILKVNKEWRRNNKEKVKEYKKKYYYSHREEDNARGKKWRGKNKEKKKVYDKKWSEENKNKTKVYKDKYKINNIEKVKLSKKKSQYKYKNSSRMKLRIACTRTAKKLSLGKLPKSKFYIINYTPEEFNTYILKELSFSTLQEACFENYHLDHIVPISFISANIDDKMLAFKIAMDLENLRLIPKDENDRKLAKVDLPIVQETIVLLNSKFNTSMPLL